MRRQLVTVFTLSSFVFAVAVGLMLAFGSVSLPLPIVAVVLFNVVGLLVAVVLPTFLGPVL